MYWCSVGVDEVSQALDFSQIHKRVAMGEPLVRIDVYMGLCIYT